MRTHRLVGLAVLALGLSALAPATSPRADEKRPAAKPPVDPLVAEWAKLKAALDAEPLTEATAPAQASRLEEFLGRLPAGHSLRKVVEERATRTRRVATALASKRSRLDAAMKGFESGDLRAMAEATVFFLESYFVELYGEADVPDAIELRLDAASVRAKPRPLGIDSLVDRILVLVFHHDYDAHPDEKVAELHASGAWPRRGALAKFLEPRLGGRLYAADGRVDKKALKKLLDGVWIEPDAPLAGLPAREIYALHRGECRAAALVYVALRDGVGKGAALKKYKAALARDAHAMGKFYRDLAGAPGIAGAATAETKDPTYLTGFWLRRMADGTDAELFAFLSKVLKAYDPEFHVGATR
jgi:hypothetical protein